MKAKDIIDYLELSFPLSLQDDWDNSGLHLGDIDKVVNKVMVALNADYDVIQEAIDHHVDLLITHHPFFFETIKKIDINTYKGKAISLAIKNDLVIYCNHTPMDRGIEGCSMNDWIAKLLGLKNIKVYSNDHKSHLRMGEFNSNLFSLILDIKRLFNLENVFISRNIKDDIGNIVVGLGSGSDFLNEIKADVDVYITGDLDYHDIQSVLYNDSYMVIVIPHFSEFIMKEAIKKMINEEFNVEVFLANEKDYLIMV